MPQYKSAVIKSRAVTLLAVSKALLDVQEVYYLANGNYAADVADLDIEIPQDCSLWTKPGYDQMLACGDFWLSMGVDDRCSIMYCPGYADDPVECRNKRDFQLSMYGSNHASRPNQRICWAQNESSLGKRVCANFGGFEFGE